MTPNTLKTACLRSGLALTATVALFAFAALGSASAATQHWATSSSAGQLPAGGEQSFTGKNQTTVSMNWKFSGITVLMNCSTLSTSGNANDPANGEAGELGSASLQFSGCSISTNNCYFKGGSIPFESLKGYAYSEAGQKRVVIEPQAGTTMAVLHPEGAGCPLASSLTLSGYFEATQVPNHPGTYQVNDSHMNIGGTNFTLVTEFSLSTPSGQSLSLSTEGSSGPYWYLGGAEWTAIKAGAATNYWNSASVPLTLTAKVGLVTMNINQCEGFINGQVENPVGGGAGTASATYTPGWVSGCEVSNENCYLESSDTSHLSGVATEVSSGPAIEWSPSSGTTVMVFHIAGSKCPLPKTVEVTGKLIAASEGNGRFNLAPSELKVGTKTATVSSEFGLETQSGLALRLQP